MPSSKRRKLNSNDQNKAKELHDLVAKLPPEVILYEILSYLRYDARTKDQADIFNIRDMYGYFGHDATRASFLIYRHYRIGYGLVVSGPGSFAWILASRVPPRYLHSLKAENDVFGLLPPSYRHQCKNLTLIDMPLDSVWSLLPNLTRIVYTPKLNCCWDRDLTRLLEIAPRLAILSKRTRRNYIYPNTKTLVRVVWKRKKKASSS